jgi:hypothetical protein
MKLIVAIGDLHGHYRALERILDALHQRDGIWRDGDPDQLFDGVQLVFTGDYIDRGRHALRIIERLQRLASRHPRQIITLLGNHELMALEDYDEAVELLRSSASSSKRGLVAAYGRETSHGGNGGTEFIREFGEMSLPAFESYVERMARTGDVGQWMRTLLPAYRARIAGHRVLFMHADLPEQYRDRQVLDDHLRWIEDYMKVSTVAVGGSRAKWANRRLAEVVWGRTFSKLGSASQADIDGLCRKAGVDYIVTGHTPHRSIKVYRNRIFDIDVGMTPACGENMPRALVFSRDGIVGLAADGTEQRYGWRKHS